MKLTTNDEKRQSVAKLLTDDEWKNGATVRSQDGAALTTQLSAAFGLPRDRRMNRPIARAWCRGSTYTMRTSNIGKAREAK